MKRNIPGGYASLAMALLGSVILGYLLLIAAYAIPQEWMRPQLLESIRLFDGSDGTREEMDETLIKGYPSTWLDNTSDGFFLQYAAYEGEEPLYRRALLNPRYVAQEHSTPGAELIQYMTQGPEEMNRVNLSRYWHGYLVVLKPLLCFFSYQDIRMLNMIVQGGLLLWLVHMMYRRGLQRYLPALGTAILALTPFVLPLNMHYSVVCILALLGMIAVLYAPRRMGSTMLFGLLGIATSYFDMLTYPLLSFGLPAVLWLLSNQNEGGSNALRTLIRIGLAWLAGYVCMWAGKWLLVAAGASVSEALTALEAFSIRSSGEEFGRMQTVLRNIQVLWRKPFKVLAVCAAAVLFAALIRRAVRKEALCAPVSPMLALSLLGVALLPLAWYFLLPNTNHVHYFFMHRALSVTVFAGLAMLTELFVKAERKNEV